MFRFQYHFEAFLVGFIVDTDNIQRRYEGVIQRKKAVFEGFLAKQKEKS